MADPTREELDLADLAREFDAAKARGDTGGMAIVLRDMLKIRPDAIPFVRRVLGTVLGKDTVRTEIVYHEPSRDLHYPD